MKASIILVVSEKMNTNRKADRNEHAIIRMGQKARTNLGLANDKTVELWPNSGGDTGRINRSKVLEIFKAYSEDLKRVRGDMPDDHLRVGFVTNKTFAYICGNQRASGSAKDIWLADSVEDTVIGGDPEFALFNSDGHIRYASEVLSHEAEFGSDGPLAELRPKPAITVKDFVDRIKDMLNNHPSRDNIRDYKWMSGCIYKAPQIGRGGERTWPIGGHIHIGTPSQLARMMENMRSENIRRFNMFRCALFACLNKAIDEMIAVPMIKVDGKTKTVERRKEYGQFGSHKVDHGRLEYRTISGEWMAHPKMAAAVLGTAKAIAHSFFVLMEDRGFSENCIMTDSQKRSFDSGSATSYSNEMQAQHGNMMNHFSDGFDGWNDIQVMEDLCTVTDSRRMRSILHKAEIKFDKSYYLKLGRMLRSLPTYNQYSRHIDFFLEMVALPYETFRHMERDLRQTWAGSGSNFVL